MKKYTLIDIVKSPRGSKFKNVKTGDVYVMDEFFKLFITDVYYDIPKLKSDSFDEVYIRIE